MSSPGEEIKLILFLKKIKAEICNPGRLKILRHNDKSQIFKLKIQQKELNQKDAEYYVICNTSKVIFHG